jgi:uncharacterized protein YgiM (DUF1202 family)
MKLNIWIVSALAPLTAALVMAQNTTPAQTAGAPAPETAPAAPSKKASSARKRVVLDPPAPAVVKGENVNLRGRASLTGETLGHLQKGDTVTVLEQLTLSHPKKGEPAEWAQIAMPAAVPVWVSGAYIDSDTQTIKARRVNLRGGPGENFSVVGRLEKGAAIKKIKMEKDWVAIEPPTNAYAYVAAEFLEMQPPPAIAAAPPSAPAPQVVNVNTPAPPTAAEPAAAVPVAPAPQPSEVDQELAALHNATAGQPGTTPPPASSAPAPAPDSAVTPAPAVSSGPPPPRIVTREGFVRRAYNVQSPTDYELHDILTGRLIDYVQPKTGLNFKIFVGTRVTVTGPEAMDARWPRTPVLTVQSVDLMP